MKPNVKKVWFPIAILLLVTFLALSMFVVESQATLLGDPPLKKAKIGHSKEPGTPFQRGLKKGIEKRKTEGKPFPKATFDTTLVEEGIYSNMTGTTKLEFDGPSQSGQDKWPNLVKDSFDYTDYLTSNLPQIYGPGEYTFGEEPRNYTVIEHFNITNPTTAISSISQPIVKLSSSSATISKDILLGFTLAPPKIDWTIGVDVSVFGFTIFAAEAGFKLDVAFGLRLPVRVDMTHQDLMTVEHSYTFGTSLTPLNWAASDYANAGVLADNGNEFIARLSFFVGAKVTILEVDVIDWSINPSLDWSKDFTTPFGGSAEFPIPTLELGPSETGIEQSWAGASIGIGLSLDPTIGSKTITADWSASGDASGSGSIEYHEPGVSYDFGPVYANDYGPSDYANIALSNFKYFFDICKITVDASIGLGGWLSFVPDIPYFDLFTFDLSDFTSDLSLGVHDDTSGTVDASVFVQNFGVDLSVSPEKLDIEPGYWGTYTVAVNNIGNVPDTFDTFSVEGLPPNWEYEFSENEVSLDPGGATNIELRIKPWRHYTTTPGDYPFTVRGESEGAKLWDLVRTDSDGAIVHALQFFEPGISITPKISSLKPGGTRSYQINITNFGNGVDSFDLALEFLDFGTSYRAVPTSIPTSWTSIDKTMTGLLNPGAYEIATLVITVPSDWAGMDNTTYEFNATATSKGDTTHIPPGSKTDTAGLTVEATKESMARYIDLELQWLTNEIESSVMDPSIKLSLLDKITNATMKKEQSLNYILRGREKLANNMLRACEEIIDAFVNQVIAQSDSQLGKKIPTALAQDWIAEAQQIMKDLEATIAKPIQT